MLNNEKFVAVTWSNLIQEISEVLSMAYRIKLITKIKEE